MLRPDCSDQLIIKKLLGYLIDRTESKKFVLAFFFVVAINQIYPPITAQIYRLYLYLADGVVVFF